MVSLTDVLKILHSIKFPTDIGTSFRPEELDDVVQYNGHGGFRFYKYQKFFLIKGKSKSTDILEIEIYSGWTRLVLNENKFDLACEEFIQNEDESYFLLKYGKGLLQFKEEKYFSTLKQFLVLSESMSTK